MISSNVEILTLIGLDCKKNAQVLIRHVIFVATLKPYLFLSEEPTLI